jgi:hypothetical protein
MNELPMFKTCQSHKTVNANDMADRIVNIPSTPVII